MQTRLVGNLLVSQPSRPKRVAKHTDESNAKEHNSSKHKRQCVDSIDTQERTSQYKHIKQKEGTHCGASFLLVF